MKPASQHSSATFSQLGSLLDTWRLWPQIVAEIYPKLFKVDLHAACIMDPQSPCSGEPSLFEEGAAEVHIAG